MGFQCHLAGAARGDSSRRDHIRALGASHWCPLMSVLQNVRASRVLQAAHACGFDTAGGVEHPRDPAMVLHRLTAFVLGLLLVGGNAAVCQAWVATAEARF